MKIEFGSFDEITCHCVQCEHVFEGKEEDVKRGFAPCPECRVMGTRNIKTGHALTFKVQ